MAASNESQGLKIAVAAFVTLTVILAVTSYFLYSAYDKAENRLKDESEKASKAQRAQNEILTQSEEYRKLIGARAEEYDAAKAEIAAHFKKMNDRVEGLLTDVNASLAKAQASGATSQELEDAKAKFQTIILSYRNEPNKNYISTLDRLTELMQNLALLNSEVASNYTGIRRNLESTTTVSKQQIDVQAKAATDSKTDLEAEHQKHESERQALLAKVDQFQTENDSLKTQVANLGSQLRQNEDEARKRQELAQSIIREQRDRIEKEENVLDRPDGRVTFVDADRREVQIDVTRQQGARPQMKMTIFDANSPGIPTEKPKGNIELVQIGDKYSVARIVRQNSTIDPIRVGDIVYSAAWSPNEPMSFALIGKMDANRDGKDDREDLKRMIRDAGGIVDYDLPPPEFGKETGKLTARIAWYVVDERPPLRELFNARSDVTIAQHAEFQKKYGEAVKEARANGIRPMTINRLLAYLGYEMGSPITGRAEAVNPSALRRLTEPRQRTEPKAGSSAPKAEAPKAEEPIVEEPKPEEEAKPQ